MEKKIYQQPDVHVVEIAEVSHLCVESPGNAGNENPEGGTGASLDLKFEEETEFPDEE